MDSVNAGFFNVFGPDKFLSNKSIALLPEASFNEGLKELISCSAKIWVIFKNQPNFC